MTQRIPAMTDLVTTSASIGLTGMLIETAAKQILPTIPKSSAHCRTRELWFFLSTSVTEEGGPGNFGGRMKTKRGLLSFTA